MDDVPLRTVSHALSFAAGKAELSALTIEGPLAFPAVAAATAGEWSLAPLAGLDGTLRAEIVDAHLVFDADVTIPIRQGQVDFGDATVEHVGPDSRMGVSRMGFYVDAPNGRSYLYQFPSATVAGVEFEQRGALLGPWVSDRGRLRLQEFAEAMLHQSGPAGLHQGFTEQTRQLLGRTAVSGELRLGDGRFAAPGVQAELVGRAESRNVIRLQAASVGSGITLEMPSLSARAATLAAGGVRVACDEIRGALTLRLFAQDGQLRFTLAVASLQLSGLRLL